MDTKKHEIWIRQELIPHLINKKILRLNSDDSCSNNILLKNCTIKSLSSADAFMLTNCYKVEIVLTNTDQSDANETTIYRVVIKVR